MAGPLLFVVYTCDRGFTYIYCLCSWVS